ncbi:gas vesicle protein [Streptomyces sp. CWNU-52B]|uniref:gas vesicle protein GvpO n=1 Tax=unclassified Streptomyces TaxID=2593676 RepID=UPI0039C21F0C
MANTSNTPDTSDTPDARTGTQGSSNPGKGKRREAAADGEPGPMEVLRQARAQLAELTGMTAESVSSFERTEDGWTLEVEVLELLRVPDTMSLLASYEVTLDPRGELTGYRRVRRYERGRADPRKPGGR